MSGHGFSVERTELIHEGVVVTSEMLYVRTPDGDIVQRQVVRHPGAVAVVAVHQGAVVLVEQYRAPLDSNLIEIPAGKRDIQGEDPKVAARRELIEEAGLDTPSLDDLEHLGDFVTAAGFTDEVISIYGTRDCIEVGRQVEGPEETHSTLLRVPLDEIGAWMVDGRLTDAKSLIGLFWARERGLLSPQ